MITRRQIFQFNTDLWALVDEAATQPTASDAHMLIAALGVYRGMWFGTVLQWSLATLVRSAEALLSIVPLPTKVLDTRNGSIVTRVKWLCWYLLWGLELPPESVE